MSFIEKFRPQYLGFSLVEITASTHRISLVRENYPAILYLGTQPYFSANLYVPHHPFTKLLL